MRKKIFFVIILIGIIILSGAIKTQFSVSYPFETQTDKRVIFSYSPHDPIFIDSDDDFTAYGFPGTGTEIDPYIIENYNITTATENGISIKSTSEYFIIRECYISASENNKNGIRLADIAPGSAKIVNNTISNSGYMGLYLYKSDYIVINNNTFSNNGLQISYSYSTVIRFNDFINDGLSLHPQDIETAENYIISNNTINGKILGWFISQQELSITSSLYGQLFLINCSNCIISNQNMIYTTERIDCVWSNNLIFSNNINCNSFLYVRYSTNAIITNNSFSTYDGRVSLYNSDNAMIKNNTFNNTKSGLGLTDSDFATIINNTFNNTKSGLRLDHSDFATITYNTFSNNIYGFLSYYPTYAIITENVFSNNSYYGLALGSNMFGYSANAIISDNIFSNNGKYGLLLDFASNVTVTYNTFSNTIMRMGVFLGDELWNSYSSVTLRFNTFINDGLYFSKQDVETFESYTISDNTVNGKLLGWFVSQEELSLTNSLYGQLFLISCSNSVIRYQNLSSTHMGLYCFLCTNLIICDNNINYNSYYGARFEESSFVTITHNTFSNNEYQGLSLYHHSNNNSIIFNSFVDNYFIGIYSQATDFGRNNTFLYNYWSEHTSPDDNGDGIVDIPYELEGGARNEDSSPLATTPELIDLPPLIMNIYHYPSPPSKNDFVTVTASVFDDTQVQSVTLYYRIDGGSWKNALMSTLVTSIYKATIGPFRSKSIIEYYLIVYDINSNSNQSSIYTFTIEKTGKASASINLIPIAFLFLLVINRKKKKHY